MINLPSITSQNQVSEGSASITLKSLKQKGLVTEDDRRFLGLSGKGAAIAGSVQAKKAVMKELFVTMLGVAPEQADEDTCMIEHVVSAETAKSAAKLLEFLASKRKSVGPFLRDLEEFRSPGGRNRG